MSLDGKALVKLVPAEELIAAREAKRAAAEAKAAKKAALQGAHAHRARKVHYSVSFHRPKTLRLKRDPKYQRKSIPHAPRMDEYRTIVSCVTHITPGFRYAYPVVSVVH